MIEFIRKRDGRLVPFEQEKIAQAIIKAVAAVGGTDMQKPAEITRQVSGILSVLYKDGRVPTVENVQDLVEKILIENGHAQTAKAYILYRKQHESLRQTKAFMKESIEAIDSYLVREDWRVNENANMGYSLQGLNNHIAANITSNYWLNKIYPDDVADAHRNGDFHIHDLGMLSVYCCGWDLKDLLLKGFTGAYGKVQSGPAKHFRTALGQIVNFFYTLQGEAAGAQAFANFDTLLAPFIGYDKLSYAEVQQCLQEFVFNMNVPTRVGFQCLSEDTEILTSDGWMEYEDIEVGQLIKTFNIKTGEIEEQPVKKIFARHYDGEMFQLKNRIQDQLISPGHRVVRKIFNTNEQFVLEEIEKVAAYKSPVIIPVSGTNPRPDNPEISDDEICLLAWVIAEGSKESYGKHRHCHRITIYQSREKNPENYAEIKSILNRMGLAYTERNSTPALGVSTQMLRLNAESSQSILDDLFATRETVKFIPLILKNLSRRQARLFLETYLKGDGHEGTKITTTSIEILNGVQHIAVDAEYGFTVGERKPTIGNKQIYVLRLIDHQDTYIRKIRKVEYSGIIWCPNTVNETVVARRNGKVFITGNTPFTNITMDMMVPSNMAQEAVVVGGELQDRSYGDFQAEMDLLNRAFCDVMMTGDASGRIFSFPIPTYNITSDLDWDSDRLQPVWEMTAKYGIPYFSNFVNSDMDPEDARSMCCRLRLDNRELRRRGGGLFGSNPLTGSIGVVTVNLPRAAYLAEDMTSFFERISELMKLAFESLELKRKQLERFTDDGLYPYSKFYLSAIRERSGNFWDNHFSTIGLIGMNEACQNLLGCGIDSDEGQELAQETLNFMRKQLEAFQEETGHLYNLEATPAEGTSFRLASRDRQNYPDICTAGTDEPYYTNSTQLPVGTTEDIFTALSHQDQLQTLYTGGTVFHGFLGERLDDWRSARVLVKRISENFHLPYFTLSPTFTICPVHGYITGEHFACPHHHAGKAA